MVIICDDDDDVVLVARHSSQHELRRGAAPRRCLPGTQRPVPGVAGRLGSPSYQYRGVSSPETGATSTWLCTSRRHGMSHMRTHYVSRSVRSCKNRPAPFPGWMSYKATKPGSVCPVS